MLKNVAQEGKAATGPNLSSHQAPPYPIQMGVVQLKSLMASTGSPARICQPTKPPHAQKFPDEFVIPSLDVLLLLLLLLLLVLVLVLASRE